MSEIGSFAFSGCEKLNTIFSINEIPPVCNKTTFQNVPNKAVVYVPYNRIPKYSKSDGWNKFFNFVETDDFPNYIKSISKDTETGCVDIFNLHGVYVKRNAVKADLDVLPQGLYIIDGKKVIIKKE